MATAPNEILAELGRFVSAAACERLPAAIVHKAKACILNGLAVGIASVRLPQPRQAVEAVDRESSGNAGSATRLLDKRRLDFPLAAFCNAVLLHSRVQEDAHPCGHLGVVAIPTALSCAEQFGATGGDTLAALVAGYEVALRIGRDHAADTSARGVRTTSAYGVFAAAACGARLMKLDAQACAHALALAANAACGLREWIDAGTEEFPFHAGLAARNGLVCASLAAAGVAAAPSSLTGSAGFFRVFASDSERYAQRVCDGLGKEFEFETIAYKPYPICQMLRAVVGGMIDLRAQAGQREAQTIAIHMHPFEADFFGIRYAGPFASFSQTFMSAPFCAALAWVTGDVTFAGLHEFTHAAALAMVRKIVVISDLSRAKYSPRLVVTLADATVLEWEGTEGADAYRLTWDQAVRMNAKLCAEAGVSEGLSQALAAAAAEMDRAVSVRRLVAAAADCAAEAQRC